MTIDDDVFNSSHTTDEDQLSSLVAIDGKRIVDIGCGAGDMVRFLRSQGADALGVECGEIMMSLAHEADPDHHDAYLDGVGQALPLDDDSVDGATFMYSLHHVPVDEMVNALAEAARVVRPGGFVYVAEPVAQGAGFQVGRLIDDETEVRAHAQAALAEADGVGLAAVSSGSYLTKHVYDGFAGFESTMVGIDPTRAERMAEHRDAARVLFDELGRVTDAGVEFDQPCVFSLFEVR